MKTSLYGMLLLAGLLIDTTALAQQSIEGEQSIEGVWAGKLEIAPDNAINVHFTLARDAAGAWSATLDSPDVGAIKDMPASSVSFDGTQLNIEVSALSGAYSGVLNDGAFTGEWTQPGATLAMNLAPYQANTLSEEAMATLLGPWHGKLQASGITLNMVFLFERNEAGEFSGTMQQIEAGPATIPVEDVSLENGVLFFRMPQARAEYQATLVDGGFQGSMKQGAQDMVLNIVKGEYVPE